MKTLLIIVTFFISCLGMAQKAIKVEWSPHYEYPQCINIIQSVVYGSSPDTIGNWEITRKKGIEVIGDQGLVEWEVTLKQIVLTDMYLPWYKEKIVVSSSGERFSIDLYTTKEEMDRRSAIISKMKF